MGGLLVLMAAKIFFMLRLLHLWRLQAEAEGRPFGDAEDRPAATDKS